MKYKKYSYLIVIMMMLSFGVNGVYANSVTLKKTNIEHSTIMEREKINTVPQLLAKNRTSEPEECEKLFGDKDDPNSIRGLINDILMYPKIIVPILVIVLGMLDLAKAVVASKEDEMRKAQATLVKRILIGVVIFLVPTIVDIIMYLADIVWQGMYSTCGL